MKAIRFETFGPADEVLIYGDVETPVAGPGEVLVKLETSAVNPSDTKKRMASFPNLLDDGYVIPHRDGAGVIEAVGEGVPSSRVGERVFTFNAQYGRRFGTAAEYVSAAVGPCTVPAGGSKLRSRRLPRHSGHDRASLRLCRWIGEWQDRARHRRGGPGRLLCHSVGGAFRHPRDRHCQTASAVSRGTNLKIGETMAGIRQLADHLQLSFGAVSRALTARRT
ncbi:alcohol dehydrogenase catalytic domain-containing protein [Martelella sp. AMO21009]